MQRIDNSQQIAIDPQQSTQVHKNLSEDQSLQQVAEQFETLFLQMVLKNMRSASDAIAGDDGMFSSHEQQMFRDMHDSQMAQQMAANSQTGLAVQIVRQFSEQQGTAPVDPAENFSPATLKLPPETVAEQQYQDFGSTVGTMALSQPLQRPVVFKENNE